MFYAPATRWGETYSYAPPQSGEGYIVLSLSVRTYVRTYVTLFNIALDYSTPPIVFDARI